MILYILLSIAIIYLLFFAFIKLHFRFWSVQPVFHLYNLFYWVWPCGIIDTMDNHQKQNFMNAKVLTNEIC